MKYMLSLSIVIIATLVATGCSVGSGGDKKEMELAKVICTVNGNDITLGEFNTAVDRAKKMRANAGSKGNVKQIQASTMENMIRQRIAESIYAENGIAVSDKELAERFSRTKESMGDQFSNHIKRMGLTEKAFKQDLRRQLLHEKYLASEREQVKISAKEINTYYKANSDLYKAKTTVSVQQVILESEDEAKDVLAQAKKLDNLDELVAKHNKEVPNNGRVAYQQDPQLDKALAKAVFAADNGDVIGPIKSERGYYVIKILSEPVKTPAIPRKQANKQIRDILASQKAVTSFTELVQQARKDAKLSDNCQDYQRAAREELVKKKAPAPKPVSKEGRS